MAFELRVRESITFGGKSAVSQSVVTAEGLVSKEVTVAAAKVGQLTTRTDDETGTLTMASGHGITTGQIIDIYWDGGSRRGVLVGTVASLSVPIGADNAGEGDVLPTNLTAITACVRVEEALAASGTAVVAIEYYASKRGTIALAESDDTEISASLDGLGDGNWKSELWYAERNPTNPVTGDDIAKVFFSNGDSTAAATLRVQLLYG